MTRSFNSYGALYTRSFRSRERQREREREKGTVPVTQYLGTLGIKQRSISKCVKQIVESEWKDRSRVFIFAYVYSGEEKKVW